MFAGRQKAGAIALSLIALGLASGSAATAGNPHGTPPGQAKQQDSSSSAPAPASSQPAPGQVQTSGDNSQGVKPSNKTQKHTFATASSGETKKYGNGKTAGQVAEQNGAAPNTALYGPGNSQPHKVNCGGHYVDVHALKNKKCGTPAPAPASAPSSSSSTSSASTSTLGTTVASTTSHTTSSTSSNTSLNTTSSTSSATQTQSTTGAVKAATAHSAAASNVKPKAVSAGRPHGGVLGAHASGGVRRAKPAKSKAVVAGASFTG